MMRFTIGLAIFAFTLIIGTYMYFDKVDLITVKERGLREVMEDRDSGRQLKTRIKKIRKLSMVMGDDRKFTIERTLGIGAPGLELRFIGQPRYTGGNRALYRHTFRISGPAHFAEAMSTLRKLSALPGFSLYQFCYACTKPPKGTDKNLKMIQIEGYLYVYDPNAL